MTVELARPVDQVEVEFASDITEDEGVVPESAFEEQAYEAEGFDYLFKTAKMAINDQADDEARYLKWLGFANILSDLIDEYFVTFQEHKKHAPELLKRAESDFVEAIIECRDFFEGRWRASDRYVKSSPLESDELMPSFNSAIQKKLLSLFENGGHAFRAFTTEYFSYRNRHGGANEDMRQRFLFVNGAWNQVMRDMLMDEQYYSYTHVNAKDREIITQFRLRTELQSDSNR